MSHLLSALSSWIEAFISSGGYFGIIVLMAIESACVPLPSEVIMPFAGALTLVTASSQAGHQPLNLYLVALAGAFGCLVGSVISYGVGAYGGREFIFRWGKYILLRRKDVEQAERWFSARGEITVFVARLLPVVRTFISLPAGIARMKFTRFALLSFLGSLPWCLALAWLGVLVKGHINELKSYFHGADAVIVLVFIALFIVWLKHHLQPEDSQPQQP